jgi:FkbM family methyltransferase
MRTKLGKFLFDHRAIPKRVLAAFLRRPVRLNLKEFKLYVRLDDWAVGARIAVNRTYEPHVVAALRPYLTPGAVVVDVGANIGYYSLLAASCVGPAGKVLAFEPSPENCALIRQSARANHFEQIVVRERAVADAGGTMGYGADDSNGQINRSISARHPMRVEAVALDDCLAAEAPINVIKIDIEGAEGLALRGMRQLLRRHRPVLLVEFNPGGLSEASGVEPEAFLDELRGLGYALWVVPARGALAAEAHGNVEIMAAYRASGSNHIDLRALPADPDP